MQRTRLGRCFETARLTLGGGGIGQVWGSTDRDEAVATVRAAYEAGIDLFDMAPLYGRGEAESVICPPSLSAICISLAWCRTAVAVAAPVLPTTPLSTKTTIGRFRSVQNLRTTRIDLHTSERELQSLSQNCRTPRTG